MEFDEINRRQTWLTLSIDLMAWRTALDPLFTRASARIAGD